ncbi:hypothetical protein EH165_12830 [Nakamurella antarctica]|uniref:Uncharacterized protein n=1 Tax=Nakamurella antarctica TaxID=1902245 RepID=A0A3G8ZWS4_9ACTN|nr:hypothetical protein [Nakamurella antarctica]AZI58894.1 hypothetical protein EH165_12830 [Nakamurella antarctica]
MADGDGGAHFARLKLSGARFNKARLPIDALIEIQRYRTMLLESAKRAWLAEGYEEPLPPEFETDFDLAISGVADGSAIPLLDRPASQYDRYYDRGRDNLEADLSKLARVDFDSPERVDSAFEEIAHELELSNDLSSWNALSSLAAFLDFGTSLRPDETLQLQARGEEHEYLEITTDTASTTFRPFAQIVMEAVGPPGALLNPPVVPVENEKFISTVAGRLFAMNADKKSFDIETLHYGNVHGNYSEAELTADLKAVLESRAQAPVVRVTGRMSWRDGQLYRILQVDSLELLQIEAEPWSGRIRELAYLSPNWHPDFEKSSVISFVAIDAAREAMRSVSDLLPQPGIYPCEDGGVVVEWPTSKRLLTLEINSEAALYLFNMGLETGDATDLYTQDLTEIKSQLREALR